jgi:four helix bundle protein
MFAVRSSWRQFGVQNSENLRVAGRAEELAVAVYRHTATFPREERFGLTVQMRRAAVSIASNIAEGCGRRGNRALLASLYIASGSASELACQLRIASKLGYGDSHSADELRLEIQHVARMLAGLVRFLRANPDWRRDEGHPQEGPRRV